MYCIPTYASLYFILQYFLFSRSDIPVVVDSTMTPSPTPKLVRKLIGPKLSTSKKCASKRSSTEVAPIPRKVPRIDHGCIVNMPPPAVVSNNLVNSENR